jgi:hypothetical protein
MYLSNTELLTSLGCPLNAVFHVLQGPVTQDAGTPLPSLLQIFNLSLTSVAVLERRERESERVSEREREREREKGGDGRRRFCGKCQQFASTVTSTCDRWDRYRGARQIVAAYQDKTNFGPQIAAAALEKFVRR